MESPEQPAWGWPNDLLGKRDVDVMDLLGVVS